VPTSSIIKKEVLYIPFFGWAISRLNPIPINRKKNIAVLKKFLLKDLTELEMIMLYYFFPRVLEGLLKEELGNLEIVEGSWQ